MKDNKIAIAVFFNTAWGEVDWILPVLYKIKFFQPTYKLIVFFSDVWNKVQQTKISNEVLSSELKRIVDDLVYLSDKQICIRSIESFEEIKTVLIDFNNYEKVNEFCNKYLAHAKRVIYPHGTLWHIQQQNNHPRNMNLWKKVYYPQDIEFVNFDFNVQYERISEAKYCSVGTPRYDKWWINKLLQNKNYLNSNEYKYLYKRKNSRILAFFTRTCNINFPPDVYEYIFKSIISIIQKDERYFLIIKAHPRENISIAKNYLLNCNPRQYIFSSLHPTQIANIADFVICVWTSTILDALSVNKPVVEFYKYKGPFCQYHMIDSNGYLQSIYRLLGLAQPADSKEELEFYINAFFNNSHPEIWQNQQNNFHKLYPLNRKSSEIAAKIILNTIRPNFYKNLPPVKQANSPIINETSLFLKSNTNEKRLHFELKLVAGCGMPICNIFLEELSLFFNMENFVSTGTFNEHLLAEAAKHFKQVHSIEQSCDLYQAYSFKEIKESNNNIVIYHSANILKTVLNSMSKRTLFFLSTHDNASSTIRSKTNTPIIEELKIIKEYLKSNTIRLSELPVIIINHVKYFQPFSFYGQELDQNQSVRKYPSLQDAFNIIYSINSNYICLILGDISIAYPNSKFITFSPSLKAYTRLLSYNGKNYEDNDICKDLKYIIYKLSNEEKSTILYLSENISNYEDSRVRTRFYFLEGLIFSGLKDFSAASNSFFRSFTARMFMYNIGIKYLNLLFNAGEYLIAKLIVIAMIKASNDSIPDLHPLLKQCETFLQH